ncbi:MAG: ATP-binding protein, partial [Bacteroidota bacterium]
FIVFHPDSIQVKSDNPIPLKLTGLQKLDGKQKRSVNIFPEFQENAELVLTDRDRLLDVSFALLDYSGEGIIHAYQLEGLEDEWNVLNDNHIRFASLPIGTYTIRVRAKSLGKPWSKHQLSIPIRILPPFYLNPSFYLPLLLLLGILIFSYYRYRTYQLQRRALLLEAQVKQRTSTIEKQKAELEQQKSTLERLIQTKDRFFAIIAHDLRGPLNNLHGLSKQVGYLIRKDRMEDVHLLGEKVEEATTGVTKLLDNLLAWALLQKETFPHDPRWIEISAIFEEILTIYRPAAEAKGVFIEFDIQHDKVHADKDAFSAIIRNLVDNALKFSRSSGKIKLKAFQENKQLIVEVSDQGVGIAPNEIDQLFAVDGKRRQRGTRGEKGVGLGLALCKELVEKHEGSISVNSHLEEGSTFRIVLPNQE